jgi:hypothetical protein
MNLSDVCVLSTNSLAGKGSGVRGSIVAAFEYAAARKNCGRRQIITTDRAVNESSPKKTK